MSMHWTDSQVRFMTKVVKAHDRDLFAERSHLGYIRIMRKSCRHEVYDMGDGAVLVAQRDSSQFVCALTDDWSAGGRPVEWGALVVLERIKKHDVWNNEALFAELEKEEEQRVERQERDLKNKNEAWLADQHQNFRKAFSDIRIANFDKSDRRRRKFEKRMESKS